MAHDVLMIAFDVDGDGSMEELQNDLFALLPAGDTTHPGIHIHAWWVANDERYDGSDCDSAVFVKMGKQAEARALLREHGLMS